MGTSTDGILFYGYDLGSEEDGWKLAGVDGYERPLRVDWYDPESDDNDLSEFMEAATSRLLAVSGFTNDGNYSKRYEAEERLRVKVDSHCSGEYPMYYLYAGRVRCRRGYPQEVDLGALEFRRTQEAWDRELEAALTALGITPTQSLPKWLLVSYWG